MGNQKFVITINREAGSGGKEIATKLGELLGVKVYGKEILASILEKYNLTNEDAEKIKATKPGWWADFCRFYKQFGTTAAIAYDSFEVDSKQLFIEEEQILRNLASQESCIIVGRTGFHIFKDNPDAMRLLIIANPECRVKRLMDRQGVNEEGARDIMERADKARENYTKSFAGTSRYDARNYDMVLNVSGFTTDQVAQFLAENVRRKYPL
ncbi:MAG: cytidylate kinase-like family protein [Bacteroidales bacterium]|jgi:cytidylate kinase|nr:cytidylate kinase-like family protein [Bacteroidales bacterium]